MRGLRVALLLSAVLPLGAQDAGNWFLDVHSVTGTLTGHYVGTQGGEPWNVDLQNDLGLGSTGNKLGLGVEYQGPRFGLELSADEQTFIGANAISRDILIDGEAFGAGGTVNSRVKAITSVLNWTIRVFTSPEWWVGIDLGVRDVAVNIRAQGPVAAGGGGSALTGIVPGLNGSVAWSGTVPLPVLGLSGGLDLWENSLVLRGYFHTLENAGAHYNVAGADLRYFPTLHVGARIFANSSKLSIPVGSIKSDIDLALGQTAAGLGVVARY